MKVAHFSDTSEPSRNGISTSLETLTNALAELGCKCLTISPSTGYSGSFDDDHWRLPSVPSGLADIRISIGFRKRHIRRIINWDPDVIHVHTLGPVGLLGTVAAKKLGIPLVHTYHTDIYSYADAYNVPTSIMRIALIAYSARLAKPSVALAAFREDRKAILDEANRALLSDAAVIILPTSAALQRHSLPIDLNVVRFIPTAPRIVDEKSAIPAATFRDKFQIPQSSHVVLFVGRLSGEKNIPLLLDAFRELLSFDESARMLLVGPIFKKRHLCRLLRHAGIHNQVIITGPLAPGCVWQAYGASDVFAFPSLTDSQGVVLDEAVLAGLPVVITDADLYNAHPLAAAMRLTEPEPMAFASGIMKALSSRPTVRIEGDAELSRAAQYTPEKFASRVLAAYESAIAMQRNEFRSANLDGLIRAAAGECY